MDRRSYADVVSGRGSGSGPGSGSSDTELEQVRNVETCECTCNEGQCEEQGSTTEFLELADSSADPRSKERRLMQAIKDGNFDDIENRITPRAFKYCESNALLMGMKVSFELRKLADDKGPDEERFTELANAVEEFTSALLDPLRADQRRREEFGDALDDILDDAIRLKQKKFFTHPVVDIEMRRKWYGRDFMKSGWKRWRPIFSFWCLLDLVLSPFLFALCWLICSHRERKRRNEEKRRGKEDKDITDEKQGLRPKKKISNNYLPVAQIYPISLETPYFKFVRDTVSFVVLLGLHFAVCLAPSSIPFSGLEWAILVFFIGRYLVEREQISDVIHRIKKQRNSGDDSNQWNIVLRAFSVYQRDLWNRLDFTTLLVYLVIFSLRVATFIMSGSVANNRVLVITGYLYSFNTLCLTFRVFGHVMEQSKDVGTIQIALFSILKDIRTIIWQFTAAIFAFSIAITKIYMAENSFVSGASDRNDLACKESGISCWWKMITYMGWTLLGVSDDFDPMKSVDLPSVILAQVLLAFFLIMGVILLINMLIALLSNTYQRIEDNSLKEWSFKRASTIQTYDGYDPIPVPLNIIYSIFKLFKLVGKKDGAKGIMLEFIAIDLDREYFKKYGNFLPPTAEERNNIVFRETVGNRQMVGQILRSAYMSQGVDKGILFTGPEAWEAHIGIQIEGSLLTCTTTELCARCSCRQRSQRWPGARYCKSFSFDFPHFEIVILESGQLIKLGIGVVKEGYETCTMPGWLDGSVAYHTDGNLYDADTYDNGTETKGPAVAFRGDRVLCTVMFEKKRERNGKLQVPVLFTLNGRKIIISEEEDPEIYIDCDKALYPYVSMNYGSSVVAKMCPRESKEYEVSKMSELDRKVSNIEANLEENNRKLDSLLARLAHPVTSQDQGQA